jgi:hypothetical protein
LLQGLIQYEVRIAYPINFKERHMPLESDENEGYIELKFGPRWKYIAVVRAFIQNFLAVSFADDARADKIAMAASELLENAVKYATGEETRVKVGLAAKTGDIDISVSNQASPEAISGLKTIWDTVMAGDPLNAYVQMMREAATRSDGKSQLGLVRIRYETGGVMELKVDGKLVTIALKYAKDPSASA